MIETFNKVPQGHHTLKTIMISPKSYRETPSLEVRPASVQPDKLRSVQIYTFDINCITEPGVACIVHRHEGTRTVLSGVARDMVVSIDETFERLAAVYLFEIIKAKVLHLADDTAFVLTGCLFLLFMCALYSRCCMSK